MKTRLAVITAVALAVCSCSPAQQAQPASAAAAPATGAATKPSPFHDMKVDLAAGRIIIEAQVTRREGALEMFLTGWGKKGHETILQTKADPSAIHAALMACGLLPGKPVKVLWDETTQKATVIPPRGAMVNVSLRWKDSGGKLHEALPGDWLRQASDGSASTQPASAPTSKPAAPRLKQWVFIGSDLAMDGSYYADGEGDILSLANFPTAVLDVPFESTSAGDPTQGGGELAFEARTDAIPKEETAVEVVLEPAEGSQRAPDARVTVEIDRFGRYSVFGKLIPASELMKWAQQYIQEHSRGEVALRVDGRALAFDIRVAAQELKFGGVQEVAQQIIDPPTAVLPRSPQQMQESLEEWAKRFARPRDYIADPVEEAASLLEQISQQTHELDSLARLWAQYGRDVTVKLRQYQATTRAAGFDPAPESSSNP